MKKITLQEFKKITEMDTMFGIENNPHIWYITGENTINIGGGNPETEKYLSYLKGKTIEIPRKGHMWKAFLPHHYWEQAHAGTYFILP